MKILAAYLAILAGTLSLAAFAQKTALAKLCWCWPPVRHAGAVANKAKFESAEYVENGPFGTETDWNNPDHVYQLTYGQEQGRRIFYQHCVWCHADATPAGPSNRSNITPDPGLLNDSAVLSKVNDESLRKIIAAGGGGVGKSAMMPPYGGTLSEEEINDVVAYIRVIAAPEPPKPSNSTKSTGE
jgi:mono/diheme cytochrome c family protein